MSNMLEYQFPVNLWLQNFIKKPNRLAAFIVLAAVSFSGEKK
jgi:hypothetical protein